MLNSTQEWLSPVWVTLAVPLLLLIRRFAQQTLAPHEELGVYYIIVNRMLTSDIVTFMIIFMIFLFNCTSPSRDLCL